MNVGRFNFSHGTHESHQEIIDNFKKVRDELKLPVAMLLDTKGPEIRIGCFENNEKVTLIPNHSFTLVGEEILGDSTKVSISYKELYKDISIGQKILIDDGLVELQVIAIKDKDIICTVIIGGQISNNKGVNVPNIKLNLPSVTEKDISDIKFGIKNEFDFIAASFVRKPDDVIAIKKLLNEFSGEHIKVISKIENREGIDNFDAILEVSDGIMVARGDLGVEIPLEEVPIVQKEFIRKTRLAGKPVITATQMLESMINNPRPTRAEVSDVANAVYDGTSSVMLSGETTIGKYPVECVNVMNNISISTENSIHYWKNFKTEKYETQKGKYSEFTLNYIKCMTAMHIGAKAMFIYTKTGDTPRMISSFLPKCPIYAITPIKATYYQLTLSNGITPILTDEFLAPEEALNQSVLKLKETNSLRSGDFIILSAGSATPYAIDLSKENRMIGGVVEI